MKLSIVYGIIPIFFPFIVAAQVQVSSPAPSRDSTDARVEHISFSTEDGGLIFADLYGRGHGGVVLAHGGRFTKASWRPPAPLLAKAGFRVLAFDFRGFGKSHGPGDTDMFTAPREFDVLAAVRYLRNNSKNWPFRNGRQWDSLPRRDRGPAARVAA